MSHNMKIFEPRNREESERVFDWLPIVNEVRTALATDPLPFETVRSLLETV